MLCLFTDHFPYFPTICLIWSAVRSCGNHRFTFLLTAFQTIFQTVYIVGLQAVMIFAAGLRRLLSARSEKASPCMGTKPKDRICSALGCGFGVGRKGFLQKGMNAAPVELRVGKDTVGMNCAFHHNLFLMP